MFRDASKFNSLGIAARGSLFSSYSKGQPMTAQTEFTNQQKEEFLKESRWPTTRQGDQNEEEIRLLKDKVIKLEETNNLLIRAIKEQLRITL